MRNDWYYILIGGLVVGVVFGLKYFLRNQAGRPRTLEPLAAQAADLWPAGPQNLHEPLRAHVRPAHPLGRAVSWRRSKSSAAARATRSVEESIKGVSADVEKGDNLSVAMSKKTIFPPMMLRMVSAGESHGQDR